MNKERKRKQAAARAQHLRDKRKTSGNNDIRVTLSPDAIAKLNEICQFFACPANLTPKLKLCSRLFTVFITR
ncbi:Hypothetical protein VS_1227 [Vibrio atlanticus]|uniref:Uncharacterized protein n=1 Tax=Vibrio atlanticus (strain LGP32) TaxID=575788 RepID=B7VN16_VIBA3|nr:Hypothetical protein VS_1227 [Vibrio atlanticus]